jgi:propionyl-CoA synthetase
MGRVDDVINVAGRRLSTGEMEEVVSMHKDVAECAVIRVHDQLKGQLPLGLVVLKAGTDRDEEDVKKELFLMIRNTIGPIACYKETCVVKRLPKTRSGKILRSTMRKIADGEPYVMPSTIDDPATLGEIEAALNPIGYGAKKEARLIR